jgi:two-component system chemotaxis response regulator CheY
MRELWSLKDLRVLIVDDQIQMRKSMSRILTSMGIGNLTEVSNGIKALKELQKKIFDLVITDLIMDKMDGFELIDYIRKQDLRNDIPIIAVSGESGKDEIVKANTLGATFYLMKPFSADVFEERVDSAVKDYFYPSEPLASTRRIEILYQESAFKESLESLQDLEKKFPYDNKLKYLKIRLLHKLNRQAEAITLAKSSIKAHPEYFKFYSALSNLYLEEGKNAEAASIMLQELSINPKQATRQVELGFLLIKLSNPQEALKHFQAAIIEKPRHKQALFGAGQALALQGDLEKSIYYFQRYRKLHPDDIKPLQAIVKYSLLAKEPKRAENALKGLLRGQIVNPGVYLVLADFYIGQNRFDDAKSTLGQLLAEDPQNPECLRFLGEIYFKENQNVKAEEYVLKSARIQASEKTLVLLVHILMKLKKYNEAISELERALLISANPAAIYELLGACYGRIKELRKAWLSYNLSIHHGNASADCKIALDRCKSMIEQLKVGRHAS